VTSRVVALVDVDPLRDAAGKTYPAESLPCTADPHSWDYDAAPGEHAKARELCRECPARVACDAKRRRLRGDADGVWAGRVVSRIGQRERQAAEVERHSYWVRTLADEAGIDLAKPVRGIG